MGNEYISMHILAASERFCSLLGFVFRINVIHTNICYSIKEKEMQPKHDQIEPAFRDLPRRAPGHGDRDSPCVGSHRL
jgi:hypothetical protein